MVYLLILRRRVREIEPSQFPSDPSRTTTMAASWLGAASGSASNQRVGRPCRQCRSYSMLPDPVVRKNSVAHRKARRSICDAIRRGSIWHGPNTILPGDGVGWDLEG